MALRGETIGTAYVRIVAFGEGLDKSIKAVVEDAAESTTVERASKDLGTEVEKDIAQGISDSDATDEALERKASRWRSILGRIFSDRGFRDTRRRLDEFADTTGRVFGRGSRNDALNFFGSVIRNVLRLTGLLVEAGRVGTKFISGVFSAFRDGGFVSGISSIGTGLARAVPILAAFGAGLVVLIGVLGPVISLFAGLAGGIFAMASSIGFALSAGLGVFVGLLPVFAAGIAGIATAIAGLDTDKLSRLFDPLQERFERLSDFAGDQLTSAIEDSIPAITRAFTLLEPVIRDVSEALADVVRRIASIGDSREFRLFTETMSDFLPDAIRTLGDIAANLGTALLGAFRAAVPITEDFLGFLEDITQEFSDWINSARGQREVKEFLDDAAESAEVVFGLLGDLIEATAELAEAARPTGDNLFQSLRDTVQDFITFLEENPGVVEDWFADAGRITREVGNLILRLIELIDRLDTPENRKAIVTLTKLFEELAGSIAEVVYWTDRIPRIDIRDVGSGLKKLRPLLEDLGGTARAAAGAFDFLAGVAVARFSRIREAISTAVEIVKNRFNDLRDAMVERAASAANRVADIFGNLVGRLFGFADRMYRAALSIGRQILQGVLDGLTGLAQRIIDAFPSAQDILSAIGTIDIGSLVKVPGGIDLPGPGLPDIDFPDVPGLSFAAGRASLGRGVVTPVSRSTSRTVEVGGITIITPTEDPAAVARETINQLAATSYF